MKRRKGTPLSSISMPKRDLTRTIDYSGHAKTTVVDIERGLLYKFSPSGSQVWASCDGKHTLTQIARKIASIYDVSEQEAMTDIEQFIGYLMKKKLLE